MIRSYRCLLVPRFASCLSRTRVVLSLHCLVLLISALLIAPPAARAQSAEPAQQTDPAASPAQTQDPPFLRERPQNLLSPDMAPPARPFHGVRYKANMLGPNGARPQAVPNVTATCNSPRLSYFGGPVIGHVQPVAVFWNSDVNAQLVANMPQFLSDVGNSTYMNVLAEYSTFGSGLGSTPSNQPIGLGSSDVQGYTLTPSKCPASTKSCVITDSDIQSELQAQISANNLPAPTYDAAGNAQTLYMVFFPPKVAINDPVIGDSCVNGGFCAYHNTGGSIAQPLLYGALMDQYSSACSTGCGGDSTPLENSTDTASHEFAESITDAEVGLDTQNNYAYPAAWADNNNNCGEVADICDAGVAGDTITVDSRTWVVQELWSNKQGACASTGPAISAPLTVSTSGSASTGTPYSFTVTAMNPGGTIYTGYTGTVEFTSSDSAATLPHDYTFTSGDAGVHTFSITFETAASSQSITATDTTYLDLTGTGTTTVQQSQVSVPSVLGDTLTAASTAITGANLVVGAVSYSPSATYPAGEVSAQNPTAGTQANTGSSVNLTISSGPLVSPAAGSTLVGTTMFTWASGASGYQLLVGSTGAGSSNIYNSGTITATSANANIPANGATVYVRISCLVSAVWQSTDYQFTAATAAALTSPTPSTVLAGPKITFNWSTSPGATSPGATGYKLWIGSSAGKNDLYTSGTITTTSATASLPTNGETLYATLVTVYGTSQVYNRYVYTAATPAALTSPTPSTVLAGPKVTFNWSAAPGATAYKLWIGSSPGKNNLFTSGTTTGTSATPGALPTNGETIYVTLITVWGASQVITDYTFTAATAAALTSPTPGTVIAGRTVTFNWSAAAGATGYKLWIGTTAGKYDLYTSGTITTNSATPASLPINGETLYVTLITVYGTVQIYADYTFTAATPAALTSPTPGTRLSGAQVTFNWSAAPGATAYKLWIGSSAGKNDLYSSGPITLTYATPTKLPTNGEAVYVTLVTVYPTSTVNEAYTFTAAP